MSFSQLRAFLNAFVSNNARPPTCLQGFGCTELVAVGCFCLALIRLSHAVHFLFFFLFSLKKQRVAHLMLRKVVEELDEFSVFYFLFW